MFGVYFATGWVVYGAIKGEPMNLLGGVTNAAYYFVLSQAALVIGAKIYQKILHQLKEKHGLKKMKERIKKLLLFLLRLLNFMKRPNVPMKHLDYMMKYLKRFYLMRRFQQLGQMHSFTPYIKMF
jgi:hypothetical protein